MWAGSCHEERDQSCAKRLDRDPETGSCSTPDETTYLVPDETTCLRVTRWGNLFKSFFRCPSTFALFFMKLLNVCVSQLNSQIFDCRSVRKTQNSAKIDSDTPAPVATSKLLWKCNCGHQCCTGAGVSEWTPARVFMNFQNSTGVEFFMKSQSRNGVGVISWIA